MRWKNIVFIYMTCLCSTTQSHSVADWTLHSALQVAESNTKNNSEKGDLMSEHTHISLLHTLGQQERESTDRDTHKHRIPVNQTKAVVG